MIKHFLTLFFIFLSTTVIVAQEICNDGIDNDSDGLIDMNDPDCECTGSGVVTSFIPNHSFEEMLCCPSEQTNPTPSFLDDDEGIECLSNYYSMNDASPDYFNSCDWNGGGPGLASTGLMPLPDGNGAVGVFVQQFWREYVGGCLLSPMIAGNSYTLEFSIAFEFMDTDIGPTGLTPATYPLDPINMTIYGTTDCNQLPFNTSSVTCPVGSGNWIELGFITVDPANIFENWTTVTITFTPPVDIVAYAFGPPCTLPNTLNTYGWGGNPDSAPYFLFDNMILNESSAFTNPSGISVSQVGNNCSSNLSYVAHPTTTTGTFQWYFDGVAIAGETDSIIDITGNGYAPGGYMVVYSDDADCVSEIMNYDPALPSNTTIEIDLCYDDNYHFVDGEYESHIDADMSYTSVLTTTDGCDSSITENITVLPEINETINVVIASGSDYTYSDGTTHTNITANESLTSTLDNASVDGCDSTITEILTLIAAEDCFDGIDNDGDGLIDLNDPDCVCSSGGGTTPISLFPNPSFEDMDCCPDDISQLNCASTWQQLSDATSDYFNTCDFVGYIPQPIPDGNGAVGLATNITPVNPPFSNGEPYLEYVGACLTNSLLAGDSYNLDFDLAFGPSTSIGVPCNEGPYSNIDFTIYGTTDCNDFPYAGYGCPVGNGNWQALGSVSINPNNIQGSWQNFTISFTAPVNITAVAIGGPCSLPVDYTMVAPNYCTPYFYLDNLVLYDPLVNPPLVDVNITSNGDPCSNLSYTAAGFPNSGTYQWYFEGVAISGETNATIDISGNGYSAGNYQVMYSDGTDCDTAEVVYVSGSSVVNTVDTNICSATDYTFADGTIHTNITLNETYASTLPTQSGCDSIITENINVLPIPTSIVNSTPISACGACDGTITVNVSGGTLPYSYSWNTTPIETTPSISNLCEGTYIVTISDSSNCTQIVDTVVIDSIIITAPVITPAGPFCPTDAASILATTITGGTWSGNGITDAATGAFDPAVAGNGSHQIIYEIAGACTTSDTIIIVINNNFDATITAAGPFCESDAVTLLNSADAGGLWSGNGITDVNTGAFDPNTAGVGTHTITYTIAGTCGDNATTDIVVNTNMNVAITPIATLCISASPFNLVGADPNGTWTGTGITDAALGSFDPNTAGIGTHTITYTIGGACGDVQTTQITIIGQSDATITASGPFCESDAATVINSADAGGLWSGNGITDVNTGAFDPNTAGVGTHTITYTIAGTCGDNATTDIVVNTNMNAAITPVATLCISDIPISLVGANPNGTWTGTGITDAALGTFDPNTAGAGVHTITYTIGGTCGDVQTLQITITDQSDATITAVGPFCESDVATVLTSADAGGLWSGNGITDVNTGTFNPNTAGVGTHTITYLISGSCGDTATTSIIVDAIISATITPVATLCISDSPINLVGANPNGTWTGTGITDDALGTFDPNTAGAGVHTITYTIGGTCGDVQTVQITVTGQSDATISAVGSFCINDGFVNLSSATSGGIWSGNGVTNAGIFDPASAGVGSHTIIYTIQGNCGNADTITIEVYPLPNVSFSVVDDQLCVEPSEPFEFSMNGSGFGSITWEFGDGTTGTGMTASHVYTTPGSYDVTVTVVSSVANGSCSNTLTQVGFVEVFSNPVASFSSTPNPATTDEPTVEFTDESYSNIVGWIWNFDGLGSSSMQNPSFTFPEIPENYVVYLTVTDDNGCENSTYGSVIVKGDYNIFVPNTFTPDGDAYNETFKPIVYGIDPYNYELLVFNRWGELIFESHNLNVGWDGYYQGSLVQDGVYVWKIEFKLIDTDERIVKRGHISVLK